MIPNEDAVITNSLWSATANPFRPCPSLDGNIQADAAIVGGGYTGLSAALHLAERGLSVVLLETEQPGWGASGRNGGQVNPGLKANPDAIEAKFGGEVGARMNALSGNAGDLVFELIERHQIDCNPVRNGWIRAAHSAPALRELRELAADWSRRGASVEPLGKDDVSRMSGTDTYLGGLIDQRGGNLHPLNYALGLADAARRAGARLFGHSRVTAINRATDGYHLRTDRGEVSAGKVLLCTNGYSGGLVPGLAQTVVPVRSVQVATTPLSSNLRASILPELQHVSDSRRLLLYFRIDAEGRFVMGGRGAYGELSTRAQLDALRRASARLYPQLEGIGWRYAWGGNVAVTVDHYPRLTLMAPDMIAGLGYNGRGVAMATAMGQVMADWAAGTPPEELMFPLTAPRAIPFHFARKLGVRAAVARAKVLDWLGV